MIYCHVSSGVAEVDSFIELLRVLVFKEVHVVSADMLELDWADASHVGNWTC
jgi:hypothetical protein